jgi:hypothetical protein
MKWGLAHGFLVPGHTKPMVLHDVGCGAEDLVPGGSGYSRTKVQLHGHANQFHELVPKKPAAAESAVLERVARIVIVRVGV